MKKSFPAALVCAAALLIPSTAYACPTDCSTSGGDSSTQLDVKDHASTQVDTDAARKEVDRARSFLEAGADLGQDNLDCFLSKVLEGSYYDKDNHTVRTDASERVSEDVESSQNGTYDASQLARWLYEHEDTWQSLFQDYEVGDVLSFSTQSVTSRSSAEFFASIEVVAVYVGDGRVIYCANNGTDTQVREESIATLTAELNVTVSLVSRPCDLDTSSAAPSVAPSESATDQSCQRTCRSESSGRFESSDSSSESSNVTNETSQDSSTNTSSESTESSSTTSNGSNESSRSSSDVSESTSASSSSQSSASSDAATSAESSSTSSDTSDSKNSSESSQSSSESSSASSPESSTSSASESSRPSDTSSAETSSESSDSSVAAPQQSGSTTAPSSSSSSTSTKSSSRPSSLPRTGAGAVLPAASVAVLAAAAGGSILARRRSRV